ncbi:hypothetical protein cyc_00586 [Cyclospora cayetanensis]|uniref:RNA-editing substrate-binding complex 6 protein domain-containing protein n=1 Tax=Cyclospora cayetanensis TaxID=88456 RepID=A0A1D3CYT3_9EIME|nr:hypothetical protein cyc_00586 [Cyclospora cayetanensis]
MLGIAPLCAHRATSVRSVITAARPEFQYRARCGGSEGRLAHSSLPAASTREHKGCRLSACAASKPSVFSTSAPPRRRGANATRRRLSLYAEPGPLAAETLLPGHALSCDSLWRRLQILRTRSFATKRQRLDEYDCYEKTLDPRRVPASFGRIPIHLQSAGELRDSVKTAGCLRLSNPNFWLRCSSAVRDVAEGYRAREIVAILNAYAKAGYRDVSLFHHLARLLALQATDCRASDLAVALQAFARLNIPNKSFFDLLALQCISKADELGPRGIATVAAAYGGMQHPQHQLFSTLAQHVQARAEAFCSIDLSQLLWGCARVAFHNAPMLDCCADHLVQRLPTCTVLEALTAAEAFATLRFYRADFVAASSAFFRGKLPSIPVRSLPRLLRTFTTFDKLARPEDSRLDGQIVKEDAAPPLSANAALYRAALPALARHALCFSVSELSAVDWALRSVGLRHDLLTRVLQQLLQQQTAELSAPQCAEMLQQAAAQELDGTDQAAAAAVAALLEPPNTLLSELPPAAVIRTLDALERLQCHEELALCARLLFGEHAIDDTAAPSSSESVLKEPELLVAQRILLSVFPSEGKRRKGSCPVWRWLWGQAEQ